MEFFNLNRPEEKAGFAEAARRGLAAGRIGRQVAPEREALAPEARGHDGHQDGAGPGQGYRYDPRR